LQNSRDPETLPGSYREVIPSTLLRIGFHENCGHAPRDPERRCTPCVRSGRGMLTLREGNVSSGIKEKEFTVGHEHKGLRVDTFVTGTWRENCYVLADLQHRRALVVDPGDDASVILSHLEREHLEVERIAFTHAHYDHVGAALEIATAHHARCSVHVADLALLRRAPAYALSFEKRVMKVPKEVDTFQGGDCLEFGGQRVNVLSCPGHTPGGAFLCCGEIVLSGDTLLRAKRGRTDLPGGDSRQLERTLGDVL